LKYKKKNLVKPHDYHVNERIKTMAVIFIGLDIAKDKIKDWADAPIEIGSFEAICCAALDKEIDLVMESLDSKEIRIKYKELKKTSDKPR